MSDQSLSTKIAERVATWRSEGYPDTTATTSRLLQYWFEEDHYRDDGTPFSFWSCQREAIETIIYLYEVAGLTSLSEMIREFNVSMRIDPREDIWPRYCLKMATGSGKTFVMALALVWQHFNSLRESDANYKRRFLLVAPNLIVLDRLLEGFEGEGVFGDFPFFVPDEWQDEFGLQIIQQSQSTAVQRSSVLHITNCQQLYESSGEEGNGNPIAALMGPPVSSDAVHDTGLRARDVLERYDDIIVLNDEAHHAHVQTEWHKALKTLHEKGTSIGLQLDFTATAQDIARDQAVTLPHVVYNYPLKRAIDDKIVKQPYLAFLEDTPPPLSDSVVDQYEAEIDLAIQKLRERREDLTPVGKKPVLFIVCEDTDHADEVAAHIREEYEFGDDEVLVIHTYTRAGDWGEVGDIKKDDIEAAREAARTIDDNQIQVVSSVLMLQEGWDVRNVAVILPLRAFDSDVLVEQTLGRGLRRMFPNDPDAADELWVIEHPSFRQLWREKIRQEDLNIVEVGPDTPPPEKHLIEVQDDKLEYDIELPVLRGGVFSTQPRIDELKLSDLSQPGFSLDEVRPHEPKVVERELMEDETIREYEFSYRQATTYQEYVSYITKSILTEAGGSKSQFPSLAPIVKRYLSHHFDINENGTPEQRALRRLNTYRVQHALHDAFVPALQSLGYEEKPFVIQREFSVAETDPFPTTLPVYPATKTVFNHLPYPRNSEYERRFMRYLDAQEKVGAFTKIFRRFPIRIPYRDAESNAIRHYTPDFLVHDVNRLFLVETKGDIYEQDPNVAPKARAASRWCETIRKNTEEEIEYLYVPERIFNRYRDAPWPDLVSSSQEAKP